MKSYGIKLIGLALLSIMTMDGYATDVFAGIDSSVWSFFWDKKLYIPFGLIAVGAYFRLGR